MIDVPGTRMTLTIDLSPELEQHLTDEATRRGRAPAEYARTLLEEQLLMTARQTQRERNAAAIPLLQQWRNEDPLEGPDRDLPVECARASFPPVRV